VLDGVLREIPDEVIEAARIDGAKHIRSSSDRPAMALPGLTVRRCS
jgi:plasmid stability protein